MEPGRQSPAYMHYHEAAASKLRSRGLTLAIASFDRQQKVHNHSHENAFLCMGLRGVCTETYGKKERVYQPSVSSFLPAGNVHSLEFHDTGMHSFSIEIAAPIAQRVREYSLNLDASIHCRGGLLTLLYRKAYIEFARMDDVSPLAIEGLVLEMLAEVSRAQPNANEKSPRWLKHVKEIVHEQFSRSLTLSDISEAVGVHPVHLSRVFRKHNHCSIGDYIRQMRVEYASRQLLLSHDSLIDIAAAAGFSDQSHFSRIFRRHLGLSPSEFKKIHS